MFAFAMFMSVCGAVIVMLHTYVSRESGASAGQVKETPGRAALK